MTRQRRGFTLVELLVVMGIIALLVALLFPAFGGVLSSMDELKCQNNLGQLARVVLAYCQQYDGYFPMAATRSPAAAASANNWLYIESSGKPDFNQGVLVRHKFIPGHDQTRDDPDNPNSPLRISDPLFEGGSRIFYCPKDLKSGLVRKSGALEAETNTDNKRCPTSYVINGSITCGDYAYPGSSELQTKVRSRKIGDFDSNDFLFIEESRGVDPEPTSAFDCAFMTPNSKYALTNRHRNGGFVSCMDGHVEWLHSDDFKAGMEKIGSGSTWFTTVLTRPESSTEGTVTPEEVGARWNPG
ncbi:MAG: type II secretion system protein [Planctomycetes bacterium]|nr:type II secretion system protein [Planctomycetota bacterium]